MKKNILMLFFCFFLIKIPVSYADMSNYTQPVYRVKDEGVKGLLEAIASTMQKPVIISKAAGLKRITGEFPLTNPQQLLNRVSNQLGLIWYFDGQSIYIYDSSEARNVVITLQNTTFSILTNFLKKSDLLDDRYPLRGDELSGTFYVSGPPIYVDLVKKIAAMLDEKTNPEVATQRVVVIPLSHTFSEDRKYHYRDEVITIPGMSNVIRLLLVNDSSKVLSVLESKKNNVTDPLLNPDIDQNINIGEFQRSLTNLQQDNLEIRSDPTSNSLLVKGTSEQIRFVQSLVAMLDKPKRHIELSVWIIDLEKDLLDQMGINWSATKTVGQVGVNFNGTQSSSIDGSQFMAAVFALKQKNQANIVSRPIILTQENVPAVFDNSRTFYTKLIGERSVELQNITYGTAVSVLPRFSNKNEIELMLNVEDGNTLGETSTDEYGSLPIVGKTNISTIARVPQGKSLLIGGYTKDEMMQREEKIPVLGDIPLVGKLFRYQNSSNSKTVRVFLIQPKEIREPSDFNTKELSNGLVSSLTQEPLQDWVQLYLESESWQ